MAQTQQCCSLKEGRCCITRWSFSWWRWLPVCSASLAAPAVATQIAYVLFVIAIVLFLVHLVWDADDRLRRDAECGRPVGGEQACRRQIRENSRLGGRVTRS